jgi:hypothetical protein
VIAWYSKSIRPGNDQITDQSPQNSQLFDLSMELNCLTDPNLCARLVQGLAPCDSSSVGAFSDHDLDGWTSFSDAELLLIRGQLASRFPSAEVKDLPPPEDDQNEEEDEYFLAPDNQNQNPTDPRLLLAMTDFQLDCLTPSECELFASLF